MPRLRSLVAASDSYTSSSITSRRPANRDIAAAMLSNFSSAVVPGTRLVVAMAPAFTQGIHRTISVEFDGHHRVEGQPGAVDAQFPARLLMPNGLADQGE